MTIRCGPFDLEEKAGEGAMGEVWRALHRSTGEDVALKFASRLESAGSSSRRRFREEVRAHAALEHPGVARVYDYGEVSEETARSEAESLTAGTPYLVMEYAPGGTLRERAPRDWHTLQSVLMDVLDTLAFTHARGVIHRDLKPTNLLWVENDDGRRRPKLADFGLAYLAEKRVAEQGEKFVKPTAGTPLYMAPEQFRARWRMFGGWTDLYQVGAIAWQWATGEAPFPGERWMEIAVQHARHPLPDFESRFAVPEGFEEWVRQLLEKDPVDRYHRAADAAWALSELEAGDEARSGDVHRVDEAGESPMPESEAPTRRDEVPPTQVLGETVGRSGGSSGEGETSSDGIGVAPDSAAGVAGESLAPPLPSSWRTRRRQSGIARLIGVGRGFFGLREIPFVDRERERDLLWETLRRARAERSPHVVVVDGQAGTGKSRLAEWFARRSHEVGAAEVLRALHSRQGSPGEGLGGMVEEFFRAWGLERDGAASLIAEKLRRWIAPDATDAECERQARALAELVTPHAEEGAGGDSRGDLSRFMVLERLLSHISALRQPLVWLDDVQWGRTALRCLEDFLERNRDIAATFVLTARTPSLEGSTGRRLRRIRANLPDEQFHRLHLEPMTSEDHGEMVRALLPLAPSLTERVCDRTEGNPLFAVQLVADWVSRDALVRTEEGFALEDVAASEAIPDANHEIWQRRLTAAFATVPKSERARVRRAIRLAAALGRRVDGREWRRACDRLGLEFPEATIESMVQLGLAEERPGGWSFVHSMLVDSIERRAREEGEWEEFKRICAEVIDELYDELDRTALRRVEYLLAAGEYEGALESLDTAMRVALTEKGNFAVLELLERRREVMDRLGLEPEDRRRVQNWIESAGAHRRAGDVDTAVEWSDRAIEVAREREWGPELGRALSERSDVAAAVDDVENALRYAEAAEEQIREWSDEREVGVMLEKKVHLLRRLGRFRDAHEALDASRAILERTAPESYMRYIEYDRASTYLEQAEFERADELARGLFESARRDGQPRFRAFGLGLQGSVALMGHRPDEARSLFQRAAELHRRLQNRLNLRTLRWGLLAADLDSGDVDRALSRLETPTAESGGEFVAGVGYEMGPGVYELTRAALAAAESDWEEWEEAISAYFRRTQERRVDVWTPWYFEVIGARSAEGGSAERAVRCFALARHWWLEYGRDERARDLDRRIDRLRGES